MASGRPDWHQIITMEGWDGSDFLPIKVDDDGQMIALMTGAFGAAFKTVKLDTDGQLYAILRGDFGGVLKTVAVDTNGVMKANLVAQELTRAIMRLSYGAAKKVDYAETINAGTSGSLGPTVDISGAIYGGNVRCAGAVTHKDDVIYLDIDSATVAHFTFGQLLERGFNRLESSILYITRFDPINFSYALAIKPDLTFEDRFDIRYENVTAENINVYANVHYASIPA